jgi:hypothetical protein
MRISLKVAALGLALAIPATGHCGITLITDYDGGGTQPATTIFRDPSFSGSTDTNLAGSPDSSAVSTAMAFSGAKSLNVQFAFIDNDPGRWLRLTTSGFNPVIDAGGAVTMKVFVASNEPLMASLGVRERAYASDPPLGSVGAGGSGTGIEWVGATGSLGGGPVGGHIITPGAWQDLTFLLPAESVYGFTGNDVIDPVFGKVDLEHLALRIPGGGSSAVSLFIDDIQVRSSDAVPEPGTFALIATGLLPLLGFRRKIR